MTPLWPIRAFEHVHLRWNHMKEFVRALSIYFED